MLLGETAMIFSLIFDIEPSFHLVIGIYLYLYLGEEVQLSCPSSDYGNLKCYGSVFHIVREKFPAVQFVEEMFKVIPLS